MSSQRPAAPPLVSCIMPTCDRRPFVAQAIAYFLRQEYEPRELLIVDDGRDRVGDLVPADPRIRYLELSGRRSLGSKRNLACREARGEIVAHWDDDDWMAPWRLGAQVEGLLAGAADACGLDRIWFYDPARRRAWQYVYPPSARPWVAGGTLCYRRAFWRSNPFADITVGEDNRFVAGVPRGRLARLADPGFYVALVHSGNTSPKRTGGVRWRPRPVREAERLLGFDDLSFYGISGPPPEEPRTTRPPVARRVVAPAARPRPLPARRPPRIPSALTAAPLVGAGHVVAAIPHLGCRATLRRAVESILAQSYEDLTLVVVNDGGAPAWDLLQDLTDPRLVRFDLERNRGRYFADAVVLEASRAPYYLIQDADDWSEPHRLECLLRRLIASSRGGAVSAVRRLSPGTRPLVERSRGLERPLTPSLRHRVNHQGLFRRAALLELGGYYGGFRIGYDTFLMNLLLLTDGLVYVEEPLYNCQSRPDSLTRSPATGMRSEARRAAHRLLHRMYVDAFAAHQRAQRGELDRQELGATLREICRRHVEPEASAALAREAARLSRLLDGRQRVLVHPAAARPRPALDDPRLEWSTWSITAQVAGELVQHLEESRPRRVLEAGSGLSTVLLADYARRTGAEAISLEHDETFRRRTAALLADFGLAAWIDLRLAPLAPHPCPDGRPRGWYGSELPGEIDFALIDGPPRRLGRQGALFALAPHLAPGWTVWLHDGRRQHEQRCVALWERHLDFHCALRGDEAKGVLELRDARPAGGARAAGARDAGGG